jgi:ornithine cyclodeaminase/alanine dehydrogenase-like protein (mu-crystallin family)
MPALDCDAGRMDAKLVSVYPGNPARGPPSRQAVIVPFDAGTGEPLAAMDGRYIREMRTAAVPAVSLKWLGPETAKVLALVGSGLQARSHLEMLQRGRSFKEIPSRRFVAGARAKRAGSSSHESTKGSGRARPPRKR